MEDWILKLTAVAIPAILAITLHEAAHGWMAQKLGDDTAARLGRVTFNPLRHIDPFGTVILPALMYFTTGFVFGWAKPVPVDFTRLHHPRRDMVWVALAGPGTNFLLALASAWGLARFGDMQGMFGAWLAATLTVSVLANVILMIFNMIPLPPLDGGRVAVGVLPDALAFPLARLERYGILILVFVLFLLPFVGRELGVNLDVFSWIMQPAIGWAINVLEFLTGPL
ncbi:site-2 protease family protein [Azospirillum sp.]|uniref:site-2 protease family protein n=1 Tax=Azospirillum sp. TaxID=34012 RepID=UPI003D75A415